MKIFYTVFKMKFQNEISKSKLKMKLEMKFQIENFFSSLTFYIYYSIKLERLSTIIFYLRLDLFQEKKKKEGAGFQPLSYENHGRRIIFSSFGIENQNF